MGPAEPASQLASVSFADSFHGLGVGVDNTLWGSSDGGSSWSRLTISQPIEAACDAAAGVEWAVGQSSVFVSTDAGITWTVSYTLPASLLVYAGQGNTMECVGKAAWVNFDFGEGAGSFFNLLINTLNAGDLWSVAGGRTPIPMTPAPTLPVAAGHFALTSASGAYFAEGCGIESDCGSALFIGIKTADAGRTFTATKVLPDYLSTPSSPIVSSPIVEAIGFSDSTSGWALVAGSNSVGPDQVLLRTADGGANWSEVSPVP